MQNSPGVAAYNEDMRFCSASPKLAFGILPTPQNHKAISTYGSFPENTRIVPVSLPLVTSV